MRITVTTQRLRQTLAQQIEATLNLAELIPADADDETKEAILDLQVWAENHESWLVNQRRHDAVSLEWEREHE